VKPGARVQAAIEIIEAVERFHQPAGHTLKEWGRAHRFAGSGDRAAIGNLVYDVLRRRASIGWAMGDDTPRALVLGALASAWGMTGEEIESWCDGSEHTADVLSEVELGVIAAPNGGAPDWVEGDYPEWLEPHFARVFGARAGQEGAGLSQRAPIDLRVNTLKANRDKLLESLRKLNPEATPLSPVGLRIAPRDGAAKSPHVEAESSHGRGHFEIQDEGSQVAALLSGARAGQQVADLCAGSGGKTLALAAAMGNKGQIHAYDVNKQRLRPIFERLKRAGARNVQVLDAGDEEALGGLAGKMDIVVIDAPCSGTGVWRRRPDAKWRLSPQALEERQAEQVSVLDAGVPLLKPDGRLVYITCSVLAEENSDQVDAFLERHTGFRLVPIGDIWRGMFESEPPASADGQSDTLLLTPASHGTDGFFVAVLQAGEET
jgi:16S rRNA (cytosine967-C5)-methyltransferase